LSATTICKARSKVKLQCPLSFQSEVSGKYEPVITQVSVSRPGTNCVLSARYNLNVYHIVFVLFRSRNSGIPHLQIRSLCL